ncbi:Hypothetical protein POVR1_LOCUS218 [uncultured virus]|nr:Hypothetical protein POVR1_LOCUS218 [uncultured virus]
MHLVPTVSRKTNIKFNTGVQERAKLSRDKREKLLTCTGLSHVSCSKYPRDKVPCELFLTEPQNPKSTFHQMCLDCRNVWNKLVNTKKEDCIKRGAFCCATCCKELPAGDRGIKMNGEFSKQCVKCYQRGNKWLNDNKDKYIKIRYDIKLEISTKNGACCSLCKRVFLKGPNDGLPLIALETVNINNERFVLDNGEQHNASEYVVKNEKLIEFGVLDFDHLTEEEQRSRGLIHPDELFIPKKQYIGRINSLDGIRLEAAKCQLICQQCHTKETIRREKGNSHMSSDTIRKLEITNKIKSEGCEICHYQNTSLLRYFEFDHLDPTDKISCVALMVKAQYTVDELIEECKKCRVLCAQCHRIHTRNQRQDGTIKMSNQHTKQLITST